MGCGYRPMEGHLVTESLDSIQPSIKSHECHALHRSSNAETEQLGAVFIGFMGQTDPNFLLSSSPFMTGRETSSFCRRGLVLCWGRGEGGRLHYKGPTTPYRLLSPSAVILVRPNRIHYACHPIQAKGCMLPPQRPTYERLTASM